MLKDTVMKQKPVFTAVFTAIALFFTMFTGMQAVYAATNVRESLSLNGIWDFYPNNGSTSSDIKVPSYWDGSEYDYPADWKSLQYGVYKKSFSIPSSMAGSQLFLDIGSISVVAKVYVNGKLVKAEPSSDYMMMLIPYSLDITPYAVVGDTNEVEIHVWASGALPSDCFDANKNRIYPRCTENYDGRRGLCGDVKLQATPKVYVSDTFVIPNLNKNTDPSDDTVTVNVTVTNKNTVPKTVTIKNNALLVEGQGEKIFDDQTVTVGADSSQTITLSNVPWNDAAYWWPHDPKLYRLNSTVMEGSTSIDTFETTFGFRQFYTKTNFYELNGIKCNLRGAEFDFCWAGYGETASPSTASKLSSKDNAWEIQKMMIDEWPNLNMNILRTHKGASSEKIFDYCDQKGIMVMEEAIFWQEGVNGTQGLQNITNWTKRWVNQRKNHPSIVIWDGSNETYRPALLTQIENDIKSIDPSRPIIQDACTSADQENWHYSGVNSSGKLTPSGSYPHNTIYVDDIYDTSKTFFYSNNPAIPRGEGEAFTPSGGWCKLNASGALGSLSGGSNYTDPNIVSQAVWNRSVGRMVRAMRYSGFADIRPYGDLKFNYEPIEDTIYPDWDDLSADGLKPDKLYRPLFNPYDTNHPAFVKADSYDYWKTTYSAVAAFDKAFDNVRKFGVNPQVFTAGNQTRTVIIYNDELTDGTSIDVDWEAGYTDPETGNYTLISNGTFNSTVGYGNKVEKSVSFTVPTGITGAKWLDFRLTAKKNGVEKFQESNRIGSINSIPDPKILIESSKIDLGIIDTSNMSQVHKIKLVNIGGGLTANWSCTGQGDWLNILYPSGNLRGEQEVYYTINPAGLTSGTEYSKTLTFTLANGSTDSVEITFQAGAELTSSNIALNKPAKASSEENSSFAADKAFDGGVTSRWSSLRTDPQWIYVDLGQTYSVNGVKLSWESAYGKSYAIQVSNDAVNWTDAYSTTTGNGDIDDISFAAVTGRYVRMHGTGRGTSYGYSLFEFEVYGSEVTYSINPVADAYVRDGTYSSNNYGTDVSLVVKKDANAGYSRKAYTRFDFSSYGGAGVSNATLRLYVNSVNTDTVRTIKVYGISDESWSETEISWNNAPAVSILVNSVDVSNVFGVWAEIDVTSYVRSRASDKTVSFLLINEGTASAKGDVTFASRENSSNKPELVIKDGQALQEKKQLIQGTTEAVNSGEENSGDSSMQSKDAEDQLHKDQSGTQSQETSNSSSESAGEVSGPMKQAASESNPA